MYWNYAFNYDCLFMYVNKKIVEVSVKMKDENLEELLSDICDNYCRYLNDIPADVWENVSDEICKDCPLSKIAEKINS